MHVHFIFIMVLPKCLNPISRDCEFFHLNRGLYDIMTICMNLVLYNLLWEKRIVFSKIKHMFTLWLLLSQPWGLNPWPKDHEINNFGRRLHESHNHEFSKSHKLGSREEDLTFCLQIWFLSCEPGVGKVIKFMF